MNTSTTNINRSKPSAQCLFGGGYIPNSWAVVLVCRHRYSVFGTARQKNYSFSPTGANPHMRSRGDTIRSGDGYIGDRIERNGDLPRTPASARATPNAVDN